MLVSAIPGPEMLQHPSSQNPARHPIPSPVPCSPTSHASLVYLRRKVCRQGPALPGMVWRTGQRSKKAAWHLMTLGWPEYPALEVLKAVGSRVGVERSQELAG